MKAPRTNTGISVLKDREHIRQGSPNLSRRISMLGNITDIKYPGSNETSSGIQVLIRFEDGSSPIHWFTLAEDYALCIAVLGNRDAVIALQPRVIYTYHPTSFFSGIAKLTTDKTQETSFLGYLENLSNAAIGFFGGILAGLNGPPGQEGPAFTPVAPAATAASTGPASPDAPAPVPGVNFNPADGSTLASETGLAPGETPVNVTGATPFGPELPPTPTPETLTAKQQLDREMAIPQRKAELQAIISNLPPWITIGQDAAFNVTTLDNKNIIVPVKYITTENINKWTANPPTRGQYTETTGGTATTAPKASTSTGPVTSTATLTGKRVLLIGSSSAVGIGPKLKTMLNTFGIAEFRNIGVSGSFLSQWGDSTTSEGRQLESTLTSYRPDVVFVFVGSNDECAKGPGTKLPAILRLRNKLTNTRSFFLGLPPHTKWEMIREFRDNLASTWGSDYFDLEPINPRKAGDGYHLSNQGYDQVLAILKTWLQGK